MNIRKSSGFTIVELLIIIVVIAILAALTIVGYGTVTRNANEAAMKSDLKTAANELGVFFFENKKYPDSQAEAGLKTSDGNEIVYNKVGQGYCMTVFSSQVADKSFYISSEGGGVKDGDCPPPEIITGTPIQQVTQTQCQLLPTYTGSNEEAIRTVADQRGGTTRTYRIAKLADNNCWMLDNLRLGSTSSSITLTSSDSDVAASFTLPQVAIPGSHSYDNPQVIGPVPGDTGSGATNYGYLYNWPAVTAGETLARMPAGSGNAQYSICPAGWRLPRGGAVLATNDFAMLNAMMNDPSATDPSTNTGTGFGENWQYTGPFKGVFAGAWGLGFVSQDSTGFIMSSSVHASANYLAHYASITVNGVYPTNYNSWYFGRAVRCLLR